MKRMIIVRRSLRAMIRKLLEVLRNSKPHPLARLMSLRAYEVSKKNLEKNRTFNSLSKVMEAVRIM
jgi:hypothetical protein